MKLFRPLLLLAPLVFFAVGTAGGQTPHRRAQTQAPVVFVGGYETDPVDRGRPVVLVAGALGVPPDVFREAFRHVHPAPAGTEPDPQQVRDNKTALLSALGRYGVTNERLDTVSNYYRYVRNRNERWPANPATAYAILQDGAIVRYVVTSGGAGYSSPPTITVPGVPGATGQAQLTFNRSFDKNGAVSAIVIPSRKSK
jgi:hypothetical protein